jgi:hypothetical protein
MTADNETTIGKETYVVNSARAWAKGDHETDALAKMAAHWHGSLPDQVEVAIVHCRGFNAMSGGVMSTSVDCDEVISETRFEIPKEDFKKLLNAVAEIDLLAEDCLVGNEI